MTNVMSQMIFHIILSLLMITLIRSQNVQGHACKSGWFGSNCHYKCHCKRTISDAEGRCPDGVCERGWFGPGCQYMDLVYTYAAGNSYLWMYDDDDNTCNNNNNNQIVQQITFNLTTEIAFTWLRVNVQDPSLLQELQITFSNNRNQVSFGCKNMRNATVNERTLDIFCDLDGLVQYVMLTGEGLKSLCSLYISGGRNIALRQSTSLSSTLSKKYLPEHAVDGNTDSEWDHGSCVATGNDDTNPALSVAFTQEVAIHRYVLYNSKNNQALLDGFTITCSNKYNITVMTYTDRLGGQRSVYSVAIAERTSPISLVKVTRNYAKPHPHLVLCEIELYGDSVCPPSKYGRECQCTCNCALKNESCFVSTGGCPSGCSAGFQGENCNQPCNFGKYGKDCSFNCSQLCAVTNVSESPCHHIDGTCLHQPGYLSSKRDHVVVNDQTFPLAAVAGAVAALAVSLIVLVVGIVLYRKRHNANYSAAEKTMCYNQANDSIE